MANNRFTYRGMRRIKVVIVSVCVVWSLRVSVNRTVYGAMICLVAEVVRVTLRLPCKNHNKVASSFIANSVLCGIE